MPDGLKRGSAAASIAVVVGGAAFLGFKVARTDTALDPPRRAHAPVSPGGVVGAPPEGQLYWGTFTKGAPYDRETVHRLIAQAGERPAILMWYQEWFGTPDFPVRDAQWVASQGIVPMITWEPWKPPHIEAPAGSDSEWSLRDIVSGRFDGYIDRYARQIARFGGPVILRPMHEMDGYWYPWGGTVGDNTPQLYVRAWRHVHDIFRVEGATNVTWVWSVNHESIPRTAQNGIDNYWPGTHYVDWVGISGFNPGTAEPYGKWKSFTDVIGRRYRDLLSYGKPIALTETGAPEVGGDKAGWIRRAFSVAAKRFPELHMVIWYDQQDSPRQDWRIGSSAAALRAFRAAVESRSVLGADSAMASAQRKS